MYSSEWETILNKSISLALTNERDFAVWIKIAHTHLESSHNIMAEN